jgi:hypothetical protein
MRILKVIAMGLVIWACMGPLTRNASADQVTLSFNLAAGGNGIGSETLGTFEGGPPYATITLQTDFSTCAGCILVKGSTVGLPFDFYSQGGTAGIFGFNEAPGYSGNITIVSNANSNNQCVDVNGCGSTLTAGSNGFDGLGNYQFAVQGLGQTSNFNTGTVVLTSFSFDIVDDSKAFTSVTNIEAAPTGAVAAIGNISDFASDVCQAQSSVACADNGSFANHAYIGVTPEPGSYLLFGSGLLALGIFLRKRNGQSASQI